VQIQRISTEGFAANTWLVFDEETREAAVIDPTADAERITEILQKEALTLTMILLTHGHFDHIYAADSLRDATGAPLLIHHKDAEMLTDAIANASAVFFGKGDTYRPAERLLKGGDGLPLGKKLITVRHTPGHTPGSVTFVLPGVLFTGDTLFDGSVGRTDLPGGDGAALADSLRRIVRMPGEYTLYPGHGEITTLENQRKTNPFLLDI